MLAAGGLLLLPGCGLLRAPHRVVTAVVKEPKEAEDIQELRAVDLQSQLQRFTDDFLERNVIALDEYARRVGTDSAQVQVLRFKLYGAASVMSVTSGPNPYSNLLDLVTVTVINRMTVEDQWKNAADGEAFRPWLEASRASETNIWRIAQDFLTPEEVEQLREGIAQWYQDNPEVRAGSFARPSEFASLVRKAREQSSAMSSVFNLANLDPTAGLEPAVREATRTRLFAERAMFTAQRMPFLLSWQIELLSREIAAQPTVQLALTNTTRLTESTERLSRSAETVSEVARQLPDRISIERKEILDALDQQEGKLKDLAIAIGQMLDSGERMSRALNPTLTNLGGLLTRFRVDEMAAVSFARTDIQPSRVHDYAETAERIGEMARDINTLVTNAQQATSQLEVLRQGATADLRRVIDYGFLRGLILVLVLLPGAVAAGLLYRFLASKLWGVTYGHDERNRHVSSQHHE